MYRRPPELRSDQISKLVKWLFPLKDVIHSSVKPLPGYEDRNFYVEAVREATEEDGSSPSTSGGQSTAEAFVLKMFNSATSHELADGMTSVVLHLRRRGFHCPVPVASRDGGMVRVLTEEQVKEQRDDGVVVRSSSRKPRFCIVLLTYIPGVLLDKIADPSPQLLYDVGKYVGEIDTALMSFSHTVLDNRQFNEPCWDLREFHQLRKYLPSIRDPKNRKAVEKVLKNYQQYIVPKLPLLRTGIIWGDAHGQNVIVEERTGTEHESESTHKVAGVIDFGDCYHSCLIFELCVMIADTVSGRKDPIDFSRPLISGYLHAFPLRAEELDCIYHGVLARICVLAVVTEYQHSQEPWNSYLEEKIQPSWDILHLLLNTPKTEVDKVWFESKFDTEFQ